MSFGPHKGEQSRGTMSELATNQEIKRVYLAV